MSISPKPNSSNFGVFAMIPPKITACQYYRVLIPLLKMHELGLANVYIDDEQNEEGYTGLVSSDVSLFYHLSGKDCEPVLKSVKDMKPALDANGIMQYPPTTVFDVDDNLSYIHPFNQSFCKLGIRDYSGRLLQPGDVLSTSTADGKELVLWEDMKTTVADGTVFDIARNLEYVEQYQRGVAKWFDGATFASEELCRFYKEEFGVQNTYFFPNSVDPGAYPVAKLQPHEGVRVIWQGAMAHSVDWYPLREALRTVFQKYKHAKLVIWGTYIPYIHDVVPKDQLEILPWVEYAEYRPRRSLVDCDINLCPLEDNDFNRAKSAIKWYEGSIAPHVPEATLAGNVGPYKEIKDGETGLLYNTPEEFAAKLSKLIEDADLRRTLGDNAKKWVLDNRHYSKTIPGLYNYYQELRARSRRILVP